MRLGVSRKRFFEMYGCRPTPFSRTLTEIGNAPALRREAVYGDMEVSGRRLRDRDGPGGVGAVEFED